VVEKGLRRCGWHGGRCPSIPWRVRQANHPECSYWSPRGHQTQLDVVHSTLIRSVPAHRLLGVHCPDERHFGAQPSAAPRDRLVPDGLGDIAPAASGAAAAGQGPADRLGRGVRDLLRGRGVHLNPLKVPISLLRFWPPFGTYRLSWDQSGAFSAGQCCIQIEPHADHVSRETFSCCSRRWPPQYWGYVKCRIAHLKLRLEL